MNVRILRQPGPDAPAHWEGFDVDVTGDMSVAALLDHINHNDEVLDEKGRPTTRIAWECSCLQGACGACAMVINGRPALACKTHLRDIEGSAIEIRPLGKFPVVRDLVVDRSSIHENLKRTNVSIESFDPGSVGGRARGTRDHWHEYEIAKCLKCGLCLEVCPNYTSGASFFGALFANDCYLVAARNKAKAGEVKALYDEHFGRSCSKALSCMDVCPAGISTIASMARLNR
jgi:succinate dehydrogenase / fumarate reductase iron-sulfur subunit